MKLGIFGGAFNPPHLGHLITVDRVRETLQLDNVLFIPTGNPPHKSQSGLLDGALRVAMLQLAIKGNRFFGISDIELISPEYSYTIDTLTKIQKKNPTTKLYLIIGADNFLELHTWKSPREICSLAKVVVMNRGGVAIKETEFTRLVEFVNVPNIEISSTEVRKRIVLGKPNKYLVPKEVEKFIERNGLYGYTTKLESHKY